MDGLCAAIVLGGHPAVDVLTTNSAHGDDAPVPVARGLAICALAVAIGGKADMRMSANGQGERST